MADVVRELLLTEAAVLKLGARGISELDVAQLIDNRYVIGRNTGRKRQGARPLRPRRLLMGLTDGGRALTLVVERTIEPSSWLVVTGWTATKDERRMLGS
jgi:hypothetical protein